MIAAWWHSQSTRDQRVLAVGALVVVLLLGWALVWHPLQRQRADLATRIEGQRRDLAYVLAGAAEIERLRTAGTRSRADRQGRSLLALADATARSGGLEPALRRVEPVGPGGVRVTFEAASFDALVGWIEALVRDYGVEATDLSADRADGVGLVNARVTLQDAP